MYLFLHQDEDFNLTYTKVGYNVLKFLIDISELCSYVYKFVLFTSGLLAHPQINSMEELNDYNKL